MPGPDIEENRKTAAMFIPPSTPATVNPIPSSSPAFATPAQPIKQFNPAPAKASVLPIVLPPATLRPLAFRIFTKKHSFTLTSSALQVLASFIGRHCGTEWREEGLAERVLEEAAKAWKNRNGGVIVDGGGHDLKDILKNLEGSIVAGRIVHDRDSNSQNSLSLGSSQNTDVSHTRLGLRPGMLERDDSQSSFGLSTLQVEEEQDDLVDLRNWLKVVDAFAQPRLRYNSGKKHFDLDTTKPSLLPQASHKTIMFRNRYDVIHQRLLRNEAFQTPTFETSKSTLARSSSTLATTQQAYRLTSIANLLGRSGSTHMILGLLSISPTGILTINDLTGSIALDIANAKPVPEDGAWFTPGMIVLVDGTYEEDNDLVSGLGATSGVGGTVGGKFIGFFIGGPPCERRSVTLGSGSTSGEGDVTAGGGFGWVDFLGVGSERALGSKMRKLEQRFLTGFSSNKPQKKGRMVILGELNLDVPQNLQALKKILSTYAAEPEGETPMTFVLMGSFTQHAVMAHGGSGGSIEYKEYFDGLASTLAEFPAILQSTTFVFVPGDNDGWASSFSSGAAVPLPRKPVPEMFTTRIKRAFASANAEAERETGTKTSGEAIWTTNPSRLTLFGPAHEIVLIKDNISSRLRRNALRFTTKRAEEEEDVEMTGTPARSEIDDTLDDENQSNEVPNQANTSNQMTDSDVHIARKLVKTILDQGYLSPFNISKRPVLWDWAGALHLYPLPTAMVLADSDAPSFCLTYEGCHVMNPGSVVAPGRRGLARWVEYDIQTRTGTVREVAF